MDPAQIVVFAEKCAAAFQGRGSFISADEGQTLETQNARFNLWADNIGVFAEGNASLDARLHEHQDIKALVIGQLELLLSHLNRVATYENNEEDHGAIKAAEHGDDDGEASSSALSVSSFSTTSSGAITPQRSRAASIEAGEDHKTLPLVGAIHAINRLHRVAMAIRQSGMASHDMKAAMEQYYDEDGRDIIEVFRKWCSEVLHHKFVTADDKILDRIACANAERRRRFLYRMRHQRKLTGHGRSGPKGKEGITTGSKVQNIPHVPSRVEFPYRSEPKRNPSSVVQGSAARLSQTTASRVLRDSLRYLSPVQSTIRSVAPSTQVPYDSSMFPPAPKGPVGAAEFYCPYCCRVQTAVERSGKRWRQHFLRDLSPFICLAEDCDTPDKPYPDQQTWLQHMESHYIKYKCQHHQSPVEFGNETEFDNHILTEHCQFPPSRLASLRSINSSSSRLNICACPICGFTPRSLAPGQSAAHNDSAYRELTTHIANDLHYVAMWSLGEGNDADFDIASNASDARTFDGGTQSDDLTFSNLNEIIIDNVLDDWHDEYDLNPTAEVITSNPEDLNLEDEWFLVYQKKPPYGGHDHDPRLENFVRRLHLEKLLEEDRLAEPQLPCYFLPFKMSKDFYGRGRELEQLEASLHPARATKHLRIMTLTGPAGIGKTKLAAQYCHKFQSQYDVVLWVHADEESKLANDFVKIAIQLGFVGKDLPESRDEDHCRQLVKAWLANPIKVPSHPATSETARWLLVFDHIIDADLVRDYWPTDCRSGSILLTSRKAMPWSTMYLSVLKVEPFEPGDSATFLSHLLKAEDMKNDLQLGSHAFHSPTQLIFLARMIALKRYSMVSFVQASQDHDGKKAILMLHTEDVKTNETDFAEWALESLSPMAAALLDVMAMLDPDRIMERILTSPPDSISSLAYPRTVDEYSDARAELSSFCFISRGRIHGSLNIHRLIQDAARRHMSRTYYRDVFHTCVALISDDWPYQPFTWRHGISRWAKCDELFPHLVRLQHFWSRVRLSDDDIDEPYELARLFTDVAWYCHERGRFSESEDFCGTALQICRFLKDLLIEDPRRSKSITVTQIDRTIGEIHHNHGCISAEINEPKAALEHQLIFNQMMLEELGDDRGDDMRLGMSFNELGVAYMINDDWVQGEQCFKQSMEEMRRVENYKPYKISLPVVNLGYCHCLHQRYYEAEEVLLNGLADRVAEFGENDRESFITGRFYHGLANAKLGQGFEQASFEYLEKARDHYKVTVGRGHHRSADVMVALGQHYGRIHDHSSALESFSKALDVYGDRSVYAPEKARALSQRAASQRMLGRIAEAEQDEKECWALYRGIKQEDERPLEKLCDVDFDALIVFWSR